MIPKKNRANKWQLILDLSTPEGRSVNNGIQKELTSLTYVSVDDVVSEIVKRGRGTLIAKMDVKWAYRNIPVHPQDRHLLGMHWKGEIFVDMVLPFVLRSAPLLFTAVADALQWVMENKGVTWLDHYIDDFFMLGNPDSHECSKNVSIMKSVLPLPTSQQSQRRMQAHRQA